MRSHTAFNEVCTLSNEQLRSLLKEIKEISKLNVPAHFKQSEKMKALFELEKTDYYDFLDQFNNVQKAIESEILARIITNNW